MIVFCLLRVGNGMLILNDCVPVDCRLFDQICLTVIHHQVDLLHILLLRNLYRNWRFNLSIFTLLICQFVSNKRQNGWTDRGQIFFVWAPQGRFMNDQNFKNLCFLVFVKLWKCAKKYYKILKLFYAVQREDVHRFSH